MTWSQLLADRKQMGMSALSLLALGFTIVSYIRFLHAAPRRVGPLLADPLHVIFKTQGTFVSTAPLILLIVGSIVYLVRHGTMADRMFKVVRALTILLGLRMLYTWLLPVQTPSGWFPAIDATAVLCLLSYMSKDRLMRIALNCAALVAAIASIASHAQYSIEIVLAPLAAWASIVMTGSIEKH
jgi:hypothetical protein